MCEELKEFFKQEFENFTSQIHDVWFFLGIIISLAFTLISLNWLFSDSDKAREMRKPSTEFMENYSNYKPSSIYITNFYKQSEDF